MDWIAALLAHVTAAGTGQVEVTTEAQQTWVAHGDEVSGKPRVVMPYPAGVRAHRRILERAGVADEPG